MPQGKMIERRRGPITFDDRDALARRLYEVFGERNLGDATRRLVMPSFDEYNEVHLFKTPHHQHYRRDWKERMIDIDGRPDIVAKDEGGLVDLATSGRRSSPWPR